jgi:hypothetical protein
MGEFATEISRRAVSAQRDLARARADGDHYLVNVREGELAELLRTAGENGVDVIDLTEACSD